MVPYLIKKLLNLLNLLNLKAEERDFSLLQNVRLALEATQPPIRCRTDISVRRKAAGAWSLPITSIEC